MYYEIDTDSSFSTHFNEDELGKVIIENLKKYNKFDIDDDEEEENSYCGEYLIESWLKLIKKEIGNEDRYNELLGIYKTIIDIRYEEFRDNGMDIDELDSYFRRFYNISGVVDENCKVGKIYNEKNTNEYIVITIDSYTGLEFKTLNIDYDGNIKYVASSGAMRRGSLKGYTYVDTYKNFLNSGKSKEIGSLIEIEHLENRLKQIKR